MIWIRFREADPDPPKWNWSDLILIHKTEKKIINCLNTQYTQYCIAWLTLLWIFSFKGETVEEKMLQIQAKKEELISGAFHMPDEERRRQRVNDILTIFNIVPMQAWDYILVCVTLFGKSYFWIFCLFVRLLFIAVFLYHAIFQYFGSTSFWCGSGSADPLPGKVDPDPT